MRTVGLSRAMRGDRGAILLIVAAFAVVAVIMLAAVVDLGDQRQERKEVTLSTDAAALAAAGLAHTEDDRFDDVAAGELVDCDEVGISPEAANPSGYLNVQEVVDDYLGRNGASQPVLCQVARTGFKKGYVAVSADEIVEYAVAPAFGQTKGSVAGVSVAAIEVDSGGGLRPIAICGEMVSLSGVEGYPEISLNDLLNDSDDTYGLNDDGRVIEKDGGAPKPFTARFPIGKIKGGDCGTGGGAGNFGQLDFGNENSSQPCDTEGQFCHDLREGFYGDLESPTKGETGGDWGNTSTTESLDELLILGQFWVPLVTVYADPGNNAQAAIGGVVQLEMVGYCAGTGKWGGSGQPCRYSETGSSSDEASYFDLKVSRIVRFADWTFPETDDAELFAPRLCAMSNDLSEITAGCPQIGVTSPTSAPPATMPIDPCVVTDLAIRRSADASSAGASSLTIPKDGNRLAESVALDFTVADHTYCLGLTVQFDERNGNGLNNLGIFDPPTDQFTIVVDAGETSYTPKSTYDVVAHGNIGLVSLPAVSLSIQN